MSSACSTYRLSFNSQDVVWSLYDAAKKEGVSDADFDQGVSQPDYRKVGVVGEPVGKENCAVSADEVKEYVISRWQKFREPLKKWNGGDLQWDVDPIKSGFQNFFKNVEGAGDEAKAVAIFWWFLFPAKEDWQKMGGEQRGEILGNLSELDTLHLTGVIAYLQREGGFGNYYRSYFSTISSRLKPNSFTFQEGLNLQSRVSTLYGFFALAGLKSDIVQIASSSKRDAAVCSANLFLDLGVRVETGEESRVFYSPWRESHAERFSFYPVSIAHYLSFKNASNLIQRVQTLVADGKSLQEKKTDWRTFLDRYHWGPMAVGLVFGFLLESPEAKPEDVENLKKELESFPAFSLDARDILLAQMAMRRGEHEEGKRLSENLLKRDPKCLDGHEDLAANLEKMGDLKGSARECNEAERLEPSRSVDHNQNFYQQCGRVYLQLGETENAIRALEKHTMRQDIAQDHYPLSRLYLALAYLQANRFREASWGLDAARSMAMITRLSVLEHGPEAWKKWSEKFPVSDLLSPLHAGKQKMGSVYRRWGDSYLFHHSEEKAAEWYRAALELDPESKETQWRLKEVEK